MNIFLFMSTTFLIREQYDRMFALGVSMYGQMTAGSYCYIGPQVVIGIILLVVTYHENDTEVDNKHLRE